MGESKPDEATIFNTARQILDSSARDRYVRKACGDDVALARRVEALLRAHDEHPTFLNSPSKDLGEFLGAINEADTLAFAPASNEGPPSPPVSARRL